MGPRFPGGTKRVVVLAAALVFLVVLIRTAWVGDDAYITFRTVDNFLNGYGLRWNVDSRVESFTHPLWLFAMIGASAVTGEVYYTSIFLSIALTLVAVVLFLWRFTTSMSIAILAASVLVLSKACIAMYYEKIRIITQDPIWSRKRFRTIVAMNLGRYEAHVKSYGLIRVSADEVSQPLPAGAPADGGAGGGFDMTLRGIEVRFSPPTSASVIEVSLSRNDSYRIFWLSNGTTVGERTIQQPLTSDGGFQTQIVQVPTSGEFDAIRVVPSGGDSVYVLGHLRITEHSTVSTPR